VSTTPDQNETKTETAATIRALVARWADAVHRGDLDAVLADHTRDIVMFDVPPPYEGVRGLDAYAATWPPFFGWQASGAMFDILSIEVTAGADVAFAHALLRCDTPEGLAEHPEMRLRLTLGLRREDGRWVVAHEHHSFADDRDERRAADEQAVREVHRSWAATTAAGDLEGLMAPIAEDVVSYEYGGPLEYRGIDAVRTVCAAGLAAASGPVDWTIPDLTVVVDGDLAVTWGLDRIAPGPDADAVVSRGTRVFQRRSGTWQMIHQHLSHPRAE
jgi:uncharacterized protein (TIGR02246 family)